MENVLNINFFKRNEILLFVEIKLNLNIPQVFFGKKSGKLVIIFIFWESARKSGAHIFSERERERRSENF